MSQNINQIYTNNPSTSLPGTSLLYAGLSPFGPTNDTAILVSNFLAQVQSITTTVVTAATQALSSNQNYIANRATLVTFSLPTTAAVGAIVEIAGLNTGGWLISQAASQQIIVGSSASTVGVGGSIASTNQHDTVRLMCVTANLVFTVLSGVTNGYTIV